MPLWVRLPTTFLTWVRISLHEIIASNTATLRQSSSAWPEEVESHYKPTSLLCDASSQTPSFVEGGVYESYGDIESSASNSERSTKEGAVSHLESSWSERSL